MEVFFQEKETKQEKERARIKTKNESKFSKYYRWNWMICDGWELLMIQIRNGTKKFQNLNNILKRIKYHFNFGNKSLIHHWNLAFNRKKKKFIKSQTRKKLILFRIFAEMNCHVKHPLNGHYFHLNVPLGFFSYLDGRQLVFGHWKDHFSFVVSHQKRKTI